MFSDCTRKQGIVYKNQFHIIFCPKYRRKVLVDGIEDDLKAFLYEIAKEKDVLIKSLEVMPDHVHMFKEFDHISEETVQEYIKHQKNV